MDTNLSQALKIAGGVLIAILIISIVGLLFRELTPSQQQLTDIETAEQIKKFNQEYQVYNKSLMYGVDVISVMNKAASNNKLYIDAYGYNDNVREDYMVEIVLTLNSDIEESLQMFYAHRVEADGKIEERECFERFNTYTRLVEDNNFNDIIFTPLQVTESSERNSLRVKEPHTVLTAGEYTLIANNPATNYCTEEIFTQIIINSTNLKRTIKNQKEFISVGEWTKAILTTGAYDFKTKKFTCEGIGYNPSTGKINRLEFREI